MVEKVEVVAWYCDRDGKTELTSGFVAENRAYVDRHKDCNWQECMTVAQHERIVAGLEGGVLAAFPTNWCDPLLTGDKAAVGSPPYGCPDIERLIRAIKRRVSDAFLAQTAEGVK